MVRYAWTRLDTALVLVVVFLILPGIFHAVRTRRAVPGSPPERAEPEVVPVAEIVEISPGTAAPVTLDEVPEDWAPAPAWERESDRWALVRQQADAMRRYAAQAKPDDPFALTEEEILAFEEAGDPVLW